MGFIKDYTDIMDILNKLIIFVCDAVWDTQCQELIALKAEKPLLTTLFPRLSLHDLHNLCYKT